MQGEGFTMQGGLTSQQTYGATDDMTMQPQDTSVQCGNGVREDSEVCDGADMGSVTCQTEGFDEGTATCSAFCTVVTSACSNSTVETPGGGGGGGGGTEYDTSGSGRRPKASSSSSVGLPSPTVLPVKVRSRSSESSVSASSTNNRTGAAPNVHPSPSQKIPDANAGNNHPEAATSSAASADDGAVDGEPSTARGDGEAPDNDPVEPAGESGTLAPSDETASPLRASLMGMSGSNVATYAMGSMTVAEAGVLLRLGWIAHIKNIYGAIPAYESAAMPFSGLLSLLPFRKRRKQTPDSPPSLA